MTSGLTSLTIIWSASPSGGPPDHYNIILMNETTTPCDQKNITNDTFQCLNLPSNALYTVKVTSINCAAANMSTLQAYTCKLNNI